MTHRQVTNGWFPALQPDSGTRSFYVYDGSDIALTVGLGTGGYFVQQRFLSAGVDEPIAGRFSAGSVTTSLALVGDRTGSTLVAVRRDGSQENGAVSFGRNAFGALESSTGAGSSINTETGFTGASTPTQTGGSPTCGTGGMIPGLGDPSPRTRSGSPGG